MLFREMLNDIRFNGVLAVQRRRGFSEFSSADARKLSQTCIASACEKPYAATRRNKIGSRSALYPYSQ